MQFGTGTYIAYQVRGFAGNGFVEVGDNRRRRRRRRRRSQQAIRGIHYLRLFPVQWYNTDDI